MSNVVTFSPPSRGAHVLLLETRVQLNTKKANCMCNMTLKTEMLGVRAAS